MLRMIFLDLDDTLLDDRGASNSALGLFLARQGVPEHLDTVATATAEWKKISREEWNRYIRGEITFQDQRRERIRRFYQMDIGSENADTMFEIYRMAYEECWRTVPEAVLFLKNWGAVRKAVITNGEHEQQLRKVSVTGLSAYFSEVITPSVTGYFKPHREMFRRAMEICHVECHECCMIGDDAVMDVEPAIEAGMPAFQVKGPEDWPRISEEVKNLTC